MAMNLCINSEISLKSNISPGVIISVKSTLFDLAIRHHGINHATHVDLYNDNNDILLRITIRRGQNKVFFNDRADKSLSDGWGEEQSLDLRQEVVQGWKDRGVTISVQYRSTPSENRFQIFFNLVTGYSFNKRLPGPPTRLAYSEVWLSKGTKKYQTQLSNPLKILFYELKDLPVSERQTVERFFEPSLGILTPSTLPISIIHSSHFIPNQIFASIGWECGREIRIYYLGPTNVLREYAYSASKSENSWYNGSLQDLNIVLAPDSNVAAVRPMDGFICIYYQDINTDLIRVLYQLGSSTSWNEGPEIAMAVKGSGLAVVKCPESDPNKIVSRIYYQDPDLYLRERYFDHLGSLGQWVLGGFNPGVQLRGTPITAEVVHGGGVDINVMWRDPQGRPVTSSWSKFWGWDLLNGRRECDDGGD